MLFDAPPSIGGNLRRAVDEIAAANGVTGAVTHLVYSHHHADHGGASSLFGGDVARIGHEETRRLLLRDGDPARPAPPVIAKYAGVLAAADIEVFTTTTTFQVMQSLRLDRGRLGPVDP